MTEANTHWYLFSRPTELQNTLVQCGSDILLHTYQLFRFELTGDGRCFLLLAVEGAALPELGQLKPLVLQQKKGEQHSPIVSSQPFQDLNPSAENWSADSFRLSFHVQQDKTQQYMGWAFPLRHGNHLLASVGLEEVPAYTSIAWALFQVPASELHDSIANHLSLGRHDIRCSPVENGKHWLLIREPELYLVLKWKSETNVVIYQSFPDNKNLMTPWGYYTPLQEQISLDSPQSMLVLNLAGGSQWLDIESWWQPSEMIKLPPQLQAQAVSEQTPPTQVSVSLRYLKHKSDDVPRLWMLQGTGSLRWLEELTLQLHPAERAGLLVFAGEHPTSKDQLFLVQDNRTTLDPLFQTDEVIGCLPLLSDMNLYVHSHYKIQPTLPATVWKRDLSLSLKHYTLLIPSDHSEPEILQVQRQSFVPFESFVEYRIGGNQHALLELAKATVFDVLFDPKPIPKQGPTLKTSPQQAQKKNQDTFQPTFPQSPRTPQEPGISTSFLHPRGLRAQNEHLQRLEKAIKGRNRQKMSITPKDWLNLAQMYSEEYQVQDKEIYWMGEAISCLDQIFNLDRHAEKAVALEQSILEELLELPEKPFEALLARLEFHTEGDLPIYARFAFRYLSRQIMNDELPPGYLKRLRQKFYSDLATLDEKLLTREHRIFVEGVAKSLNDQELVARAKQRYRTRLETNNRILQELPHVVRP